MPSGYNEIGSRAPKKPTDFWLPSSGQAPANAAGREFEIRGLAVTDFAYGAFLLNNGDVARFNSDGVLIEILGDDEGGTGLSAFTQYWTPLFMPGTNIEFVSDMITTIFGGTLANVTVSPDAKSLVASLPAPGVGNNNNAQAAYDTSVFIPANNDNNGYCFKLSDPVAINGASLYSYVMLTPNETFVPGTSSAYVLGLMRLTGQDYYNIMFIGHTSMGGAIDDMTTFDGVGANPPPIALLWNANAEYTLSFDANQGAFGTINFYSSIANTPATPLASHALTASGVVPV